MTQSGAECGKCSLATMPREKQAGLGLPAAGLQRRVRRAGRWMRGQGSEGAADEAPPELSLPAWAARTGSARPPPQC